MPQRTTATADVIKHFFMRLKQALSSSSSLLNDKTIIPVRTATIAAMMKMNINALCIDDNLVIQYICDIPERII